MRKVELLAPAGNYEAFLGAVHGGADAVYMGGTKFGARAYADNFTEEEMCRAIRYAHIYGRKVYLTLNTLVKTKEFPEIYDYLSPFYRAGLDGVIIQDFGVFHAVRRWFPDLALHASTQMAITGTEGAQFLKELGAQRIVPARELSLKEIRKMKEAVDIEIETFIHGAVCYCYSGQCLFSSMIGGRSGNRGRCAQPCRLPYQIGGSGKKVYPLSLKDMCTIEILPELIEAGIDSLKIEGRMKSPEYAAGVTALYRKYIDRYYRNPEEEYRVSGQDMEELRALYIRSGISEGYYHQHNGQGMITLDSPSYAGRDENLACRIRKEYLEGDFRLPAAAKAVLRKGSPAMLQLKSSRMCKGAAAMDEGGTAEVTVTGEPVQAARKCPLTMDAVRKQLAKSGNSVFRVEQIETEMDEDIFLPVKALNDLRRTACEKLEECIAGGRTERLRARETSEGQRSPAAEGNTVWPETAGRNAVCLEAAGRNDICPDTAGRNAVCLATAGRNGICTDTAGRNDICANTAEEGSRAGAGTCRAYPNRKHDMHMHVSALTKEQGMAAARKKAERLYLDSGLCGDSRWLAELKRECGETTELYLAMPYILRTRDGEFLKEMERLLRGSFFDGVLVRNAEELHWVVKTFGKPWEKRVVTDAGLYIWNPEAAALFGEYGSEHYLPYELNAREVQDLIRESPPVEWAAAVYGRIPMMVTANCVVKTEGGCRPWQDGGRTAFTGLTDRYRKVFPVYTDCTHCYNVIYNSLPLSLHQKLGEMENMGIRAFRLDFTDETGHDAEKICRFFAECMEGSKGQPPCEYTNGHWKRGVE